MSNVDEVEKIFKAVPAFPNDVMLASLAQECMTIVSHLERQLEEARYSATDYAMKLGRANEKLEEVRGLYKHAIDSLNFIHQFTECDRARDCSKIELDRLMTSEFYKLKEKGDEN